jgi:hypothetical protein
VLPDAVAPSPTLTPFPESACISSRQDSDQEFGEFGLWSGIAGPACNSCVRCHCLAELEQYQVSGGARSHTPLFTCPAGMCQYTPELDSELSASLPRVHFSKHITDAKLTRPAGGSLRQWSGFWFYSLVTRTGALNHRLFHS